MRGIRSILVGALGTGLLVIAAPGVSAYAMSGGRSSTGHSTYKVSVQTVKLSPIVVDGQRLVLPLYLQMVKTALHRSWSPLQANKNQLVCRFQTMMGSRLQTMRCMTNGQHFKEQRDTQIALANASSEYTAEGSSEALRFALDNAQIPASIANYTDQHRVSPGAIRALLKKMPPAGSSYTLRITDHGKPVVDYVIKNGELKAVHHYVYKKKGKK